MQAKQKYIELCTNLMYAYDCSLFAKNKNYSVKLEKRIVLKT